MNAEGMALATINALSMVRVCGIMHWNEPKDWRGVFLYSVRPCTVIHYDSPHYLVPTNAIDPRREWQIIPYEYFHDTVRLS